MGFDHAILLIEARGNKIINLKIPGCRPCLSPDGKQIAWGAGDHEFVAAPIDLEANQPTVGKWTVRIKDETNKIYHVDWSPDSRFLGFSRGPDGEGDPSKPGTFQAAGEIVGVYAPGWNIGVVRFDGRQNCTWKKPPTRTSSCSPPTDSATRNPPGSGRTVNRKSNATAISQHSVFTQHNDLHPSPYTGSRGGAFHCLRKVRLQRPE